MRRWRAKHASAGDNSPATGKADDGPATGTADDADAPASSTSSNSLRAQPDDEHSGRTREPADEPRGGPAPTSTAPTSPVRLPAGEWSGVLRRAVREYRKDNVSDWAAALTYRAILSLFPALLVLVAGIGLLSESASARLLTNVQKHAPSAVRSTIGTIFHNAQQNHTSAGVIGLASLLVALWSASGYVAAFMRASNAIYDIGEGRPIWKKAPLRIGLTLALVIAVVVLAAIAVLSRGIASDVGSAIGLGHTAVDIWSVIKWPILVVIASLALALLYWAAPNAKQAGFSWITPGGFLTVIVWALASAGFGFYAANFSSYQNTYGSLAGVVIFLIWLWISNIALLLGAEFNAELQRARAIQAGMPEDQEPYVALRDSRKLSDVDRERAEALSRHIHYA